MRLSRSRSTRCDFFFPSCPRACVICGVQRLVQALSKSVRLYVRVHVSTSTRRLCARAHVHKSEQCCLFGVRRPTLTFTSHTRALCVCVGVCLVCVCVRAHVPMFRATSRRASKVGVGLVSLSHTNKDANQKRPSIHLKRP